MTKEENRAYFREYRAKNREKIRIRQQKWMVENPEKCAEAARKCNAKHREQRIAYKAKYRSENREKCIAATKAWNAVNRDRVLQNQRRWRTENPKKALEAKRKWEAANSERVRARRLEHYAKNRKRRCEYSNTYRRKRHRSNPAFRTLCGLRCRLRDAVKGIAKAETTLKLTGTTLPELMAHLESQFKDGMTWENQGYMGWHVDHIRPCASFDFTDPEEQKRCFHYTNLQPLWARENMTKHKKVINL